MKRAVGKTRYFSGFWMVYSIKSLTIKSGMGKVQDNGAVPSKPGGQKEFYKRLFTMEQWGKCCVSVRNMENMLFNTAGSGINKSQTQTIKNIKVVYHVPTPFSSVVCYKENLLLNGIQFWLNYQRHFPYENHSLTCVINSSLAILIYFYHREIGAGLKGNSTLHFRLLFKALLPLHLQLLSTEQRLSSRFFCTAKLD